LRIASFIALAAIVAATGYAADLPEGPGKATMLKICGGCHPPEKSAAYRYTKEEWGERINKMVELGAKGTEEQFYEVWDYLAQHFPPNAAGPKVNVNKADAKELTAELDFPPKEAEAIVRYREQNGNFKSMDDLKKVPGLDLKKLDARKERLAF
jgi:competence protein ComEA